MGVIFKQSFSNTVITYLAFALGGVNALFLYTYWLSDAYYGLVTFLLSTSNIIMPLIAFGVQHSIIKFYSACQTKQEQDRLLFMALVLPIFIAIPFALLGAIFYENIAIWLSEKNTIVKDYVFLIYIIALMMAYFEVFYAWSKVQLKSVFGNTMKEFFTRTVVMVLLILVYFKVLDEVSFIYTLTVAYLVRMLIMMGYAFYIRKPKLTFRFPKNFKAVMRYSFYIILASTAGSMVLDIDKFMIPQKIDIAQTAFYAVAVYIGSVIEVPGRAMSQIIQPITAQCINDSDQDRLQELYKKSHINLMIVSGLFFILINTNIQSLYAILPEKYSGGIWVVLMISLTKLSHMFLGNNGVIISNSKYYKILFPYSVLMSLAVVLLNAILIGYLGINGAALSTLMVVLLFNGLKLWYVKQKFSLTPYTDKTLIIILVLIIFLGIFYFLEFPWHPIISIILKSTIIGVAYIFIVIHFKLSNEIYNLWLKFGRDILFKNRKF